MATATYSLYSSLKATNERAEGRGIKVDPLEFLRQQAEEQRRMRERILEHIRRPPTLLPVFVSESREREAVVHPYAGDGGESYQVTYWDSKGPVGDTVTHDLSFIADDLISGGYTPTDSPRWIK